MSRIGRKPIIIPDGVEVKIEGQKVTIKGPKGEISREFRPELDISSENNKITIKIKKETKQVRAIWGLTRTLIANLIQGATSGYEKKLEIEGVGYKTNIEGSNLVLNLGFSHSVKVAAPEGIKFSVEKNTIVVSGIDKELVGQIAAKIRRIKPPEPYKGKGIRYSGEYIRRKLGKKAVATAK